MELEATYICAYCLQENTILVDTSGGIHQEFIEDCQVCCKANKIVVSIDDLLEEAIATSETI